MLTSLTTRVNTFLLVLIALMAAAIIAILVNRADAGPLDPPGPPSSTAGVLHPGTPITALPYTISQPGSYYLTGNLTMAVAGDDGIQIVAKDVTLDLGGFTLNGAGIGHDGVVVGTVDDDGITIRNGSA